MDSDKFPFYRAELYHQFHNDFQVRGGGWVSGRPRPGLGRGQLASRLGQLPSRVGRGDTPTPLHSYRFACECPASGRLQSVAFCPSI